MSQVYDIVLEQINKTQLYVSICNNFEIVGKLIADFYQHFCSCFYNYNVIHVCIFLSLEQ